MRAENPRPSLASLTVSPPRYLGLWIAYAAAVVLTTGPGPSTEDGFEYEPAYDPALETYDYERSHPRSTPPHGNNSNSNGSIPRSRRPDEAQATAKSHDQQHAESQPQPQERSRAQAPVSKRQRSEAPRRRDDLAMRNAMGPSLWQLVTAAIPDDVEDSPQAQREGPAGREWPGAPMWSTPPPQMQMPDGDDYEGTRRKRRADIFW